MLRRLEPPALRLLSTADGMANRWFTWRFNPLYQSGTIVVALYLVVVVTGLWLLIFYRVGSPWESVASLTSNLWVGNWVRGLHRYASDAAVVFTLIHGFRMFAQGRSWGARWLAWSSGVGLLGLLMLCGWTGYVMVWDSFGEYLARQGAAMLDTLPFLSEPASRAFTGEQPVPSAFFFITLFAHIGIPLFMAIVFWLHVKRLARPAMLPSRQIMWGTIGWLTAAAIVRPLVMAPKADPFLLPAEIPVDLFFAFWTPFPGDLRPAWAVMAFMGAGLGLAAVPLFTRPARSALPPASQVDEDICVGCRQCALDCPYGAIEMVKRVSPRSELVARVDASLCVSCGICAASCAPMGVGPAGHSGRDQLDEVHTFLGSVRRQPNQIVVVGCAHGAGARSDVVSAEGAVSYPVDCVGNLHTSVIEFLIRGGARGVLVVSCPPRDCRHREGPNWLTERINHGRDAELQARVDRSRVRIVYATLVERQQVADAVRAFTADLAAISPVMIDATVPAASGCDSAQPVVTL